MNGLKFGQEKSEERIRMWKHLAQAQAFLNMAVKCSGHESEQLQSRIDYCYRELTNILMIRRRD